MTPLRFERVGVGGKRMRHVAVSRPSGVAEQ
jgi:hypothetical protein